MRFTRVIFGVSASPLLLNASIKHHIESYAASQPDIVRLLARSIYYVDDVVCGADREREAYMVYTSSREILGQGCFNLRSLSQMPPPQTLVDAQEATRMEPPDHKSEANVVEADETYVEAIVCLSTQPSIRSLVFAGIQHLTSWCLAWMPYWKNLR